MKHALVTGGAGFIGSHVVDALLSDDWAVTVVDNFDPFYDPAIKHANLGAHRLTPRLTLVQGDVRDLKGVRAALGDAHVDVIVHLAARAGVRPSIDDPIGYQDVNVTGTQQMLELARTLGVPHFVFASSSSVYGVNPHVPWREDDSVLQPISPYASTKVSGELLGHVYSHLYGFRFIGLRLFTVYGPRQRPDLAIHRFAGRMLAGQSIPVYGDGSTRRDYTFVADVVQGISAAIEYRASQYEIINIGNNHTVTLTEMIATLEQVFGVRAVVDRRPAIAGDVPQTWASIEKARALLRYEPKTAFAAGVLHFAEWLRQSALVPSTSKT